MSSIGNTARLIVCLYTLWQMGSLTFSKMGIIPAEPVTLDSVQFTLLTTLIFVILTQPGDKS